MTESLTDWLQRSRVTVVAVDPAGKRLRIRGDAPACTDLHCHDETVVVTDENAHAQLEDINPGDIVKVETSGRAQRIVVVRRVWEELTSPEF